MEKIKKFLLAMGFKKNEAEVYNSLIEFGTSSVSDLAKETSLHRPNIYDALHALVKIGLVYEVNESPTLFVAQNPKVLLNYVQRKEVELQSILKEYEERNLGIKSKDVKVKMTKGVFAARQAVYSLLSVGKEIDVYGVPTQAIKLLGGWILNTFHQERIKKGISMRHIYNSDCGERAKQMNKLKFAGGRVLPRQYDSMVTTNIAGYKVVLIVWDKELTVIEIEDESVAKHAKIYFEILWKKAKVPE